MDELIKACNRYLDATDEEYGDADFLRDLRRLTIENDIAVEVATAIRDHYEVAR